MAKVKIPKNSKKSRFFSLSRSGDALVATFTSPRKVVESLKKNSRSRDKVFTVNSN